MQRWTIKKSLIFLLFFLFTILGNLLFASFVDIAGHRYEQGIQTLAEMGVVQGYAGGLYKPDQSVTRAEMLKIILVAGNIELMPVEEKCFKDVKGNERYADVVCTAKGLGIVNGYADGTFKPNQKVSFVEGLKIALLGLRIDVPAVESHLWYQSYVDYVDQQGIFSKYEGYPEQTMTRGMMAHLVAALVKGQTGNQQESRLQQSPWCSKSQPFSVPSAVMVGGLERHFLLQVGRNYRQDRPAKLIFGFHGRTSDNATVAGYYDLDDVEGNAIFVYPLGLPEEWPQRNWRSGGDRVNALRDYELFDEIVKLVNEEYCIDQSQVYVAGHSLGGRFTSMLNCARGSKIRGTGIVAGSPMKFPACSGPSAAIIFHNPEDALATFAGGEQIRNMILKQNQCWTETREYANRYGMECVEYTQCLPWAGVVFCKYFTGGHYWPNGATQMMFDFWQKQ